MKKLQFIEKATEKLAKVTGRTGLVISKNSPEILVGLGIAGIIGSTIMACRATLKVDQLMEEHEGKLDKINTFWQDIEDGKRTGDNYTEDDKDKDIMVTYAQTSFNFVKLYAPAVLLSVASIAMILKSHSIMRTRNIALMAAYETLDKGFKAYRKRVVEELGEEKDYMFKNGLRSEKVTEIETDENGKSHKVTKEVLVKDDTNTYSQYSRFFDESCSAWTKTPEYNKMFLRTQQNYFNDLLRTRGHVFLNEVYDALGMERSKAGSIVGWIMAEGSDNFIDFGIFDGSKERARAFVNGQERTILLDFNVDGVIFDRI